MCGTTMEGGGYRDDEDALRACGPLSSGTGAGAALFAAVFPPAAPAPAKAFDLSTATHTSVAFVPSPQLDPTIFKSKWGALPVR